MFQNHPTYFYTITQKWLVSSLLLVCILFTTSNIQAQTCVSGDCNNGSGRWKSQNGDAYEGTFRSGKFSGKGTMRYANGDRYTGDWVGGSKHGTGTYVWVNGDVYEGGWYSDKRYGRGRIVFMDGRKYQGSWVDNAYEGAGRFIWTDGSNFKGYFKKGIPMSGILRFDRQSSFQGKWERKRSSATDYYYRFISKNTTIATWDDGHLTDKRDSNTPSDSSPISSSDNTASTTTTKYEKGPSFDGNENLPNDGKPFAKNKENNNKTTDANNKKGNNSSEGKYFDEEGNLADADSDAFANGSTANEEGDSTTEGANKGNKPPPLPAPKEDGENKSISERYGENFTYLIYQLESDKNVLLRKQKQAQEEMVRISESLKNEDLSPEDKKQLESFLHKMEETMQNTTSELQKITANNNKIIQDMRSTILEQKSTIQTIKEDQEKKRNQLILTASMLCLAFISLGIMFNLYRNLKKKNTRIAQQNREIALKNEVIEESRNELAKQNRNVISSINYASRMQTAMLPSHDILTDVFPEGFVLLMPCKIVSGDFYWITRREHYTFVAAIDCTGHGVPGAFMSLIGNDIMNDIVLRKKLTAPQEILEELHKEVVLHMTRGNKESRDGMDLGLCVVDHKTQQLHFAGAMNPLLIAKNGKIEEVRGTRKPIGGQQLERRSEKPFEGHTIQLEGNESCYLLSDGYRDQFGGPDNKKLMKKGFTKMLGTCQHLSMEEQKIYIENFFNEWKGDLDQLDDVLVIGFKPLASANKA